VAVYTRIDEDTARDLLARVAPSSSLRALTALPHGSINTTYRLDRADGPPLYLRINEGKPLTAIAREVALVSRLARVSLGAATPQLLRTAAGEAIVHLEVAGGRHALVFAALPGEDLARESVTAAHTVQVGAFLARAHAALRRVPGRMPNPFAPRVVNSWLHELRGFERLAPVIARLSKAHAAARKRRRPLPRTVVHGDLFIDNTKWTHAQGTDVLAAVFDWEMAGRDARMLDVATALHAWCTSARGIDEATASALVAGYRSVSPLSPSERRGLFHEAVLAAIRFATSRIRDFEVRQGGERAFLDYRDFVGRLDVLEGMGERAFLRALGLA
jgi:homoserine kinase type II